MKSKPSAGAGTADRWEGGSTAATDVETLASGPGEDGAILGPLPGELAQAQQEKHLEELVAACREVYHNSNWIDLLELAAQGLVLRPDNYNFWLFVARARVGLRQWGEAARAWGRVTELRPEWPEGHFQLARALVRSDDLPRSTQVLHTLAQLVPRDALWLGRLLGVGSECCNIDLVRTAARELVGSFPKSIPGLLKDGSLNTRAQLFLAQAARGQNLNVSDLSVDDLVLRVERTMAGAESGGALVEACADATSVLECRPDHEGAKRVSARITQSLFAAAHRDLGDHDSDSAERRLWTLCYCDSGNVEALLTYGRLLMTQKKWELALGVWSDLVARIDPKNGEAQRQIARALERSGRFEEAHDAWKSVATTVPGDSEATEAPERLQRLSLYAGRLALSEGRLVEAARVFQNLRKRYPNHEEAARRLDHTARRILSAMRLSYREGAPNEVLHLASAAIQQFPDNAEFYLLIGRATTAQRQWHLALSAWRKYLSLAPEDEQNARVQIERCAAKLYGDMTQA